MDSSGMTASAPFTIAVTCGDDAKDSLVQQYVSNSFFGSAGITDVASQPPRPFAPRCMDITKSAGSQNYSFSALNSSNFSDSTVALLAESLLAGQGVRGVLVPTLSKGLGLDGWVANFGSVPLLNGPLNEGSGFRPPLDQARVYVALGKKPIPAGRHMFGDAVDLPVIPAGDVATYYQLLNAAINAGADYTESDQKAIKNKLACSPAVMHCVHADWRKATSLFGGTSPYAE
jgi:hypothetical protein